jgi:hypothetical protein
MNITGRRYTRFLADDNAFAALGSNYSKVGKIKDISLGGLVFVYLNNSQAISGGVSKISIFLSDKDFHLPDLTCRIICDTPTSTIDQNVFCSIQNNRCAVQFLSLSDFHKGQLGFFIRNYTIGLGNWTCIKEKS